MIVSIVGLMLFYIRKRLDIVIEKSAGLETKSPFLRIFIL